MVRQPTYKELEQRVKALEKESFSRIQAEKALLKSEERYRRITDAITDYIYTVRVRDGYAVETVHSPTCVAVTGYAIKDFEDNPYLWIQMVPEEDRAVVAEHTARTLSGETVEPIEHRIIRKDGAVRWVRSTQVSYYDSEGRVTAYDGLLQDITERKRAEEAMRESEEKYRTIFESTGTATIIGDEDTTISMVNSEFEVLSGYSRQEIEGKKSWTEFVWKEDLEHLIAFQRLRRIDPAAAPRTHEFRFVTKQGYVGHVFATVGMIPRTTKGVASFSDISDLKRAEEEIRRINEELNSFVRVVSHDLRNPIISIQGLSFRLLRAYRNVLEQKAVSYLEQIMSDARRMELLASDLLTFTKLGQVVSTLEPVSSHEIVANVVSGIQHRLVARPVELVMADNLPEVSCDRERLHRVFENLLVNAIKFTGQNQEPKIEIGYKDAGDFHEFYVKDNGIGIDPAHHRKIFEVFSRLREIEDPEGTGLGLAIVERIVKDHGGSVWVESEKGKGAIFRFRLPKTRKSDS